jgi:hypothetical protein
MHNRIVIGQTTSRPGAPLHPNHPAPENFSRLLQSKPNQLVENTQTVPYTMPPRRTYEFLVRYPHGASAINGYRRAARHFGLHTWIDPGSAGGDSTRLFIHEEAQRLRQTAARLSEAHAAGDDGLIASTEEWLAVESGVHWFHHDWKHWAIEQDEGALECLGWERTVSESGPCFRVNLRLKQGTTRKGDLNYGL